MKRWLIAAVTFALRGRGVHGGRRGQHPVRDRHRQQRLARPGDAHDLGGVDGTRARAVQPDLRRVHREVPVDHGESVGGVDDPKIIAAINSGTPPDVVLSFTLDSVGQFCASGAWQDLNPYIEQSGFDVEPVPGRRSRPTRASPAAGARSRSSPTRTGCTTTPTCSTKAGITGPAEDAHRARRTTRRSSPSSTPTDRSRWPGSSRGSATTSSSVAEPREHLRREVVQRRRDRSRPWRPTRSGRRCSSGSTTSSRMSTATGTSRPEPTGSQRFVAGAGDEFSTAHDLHTGTLAMNIDGEWRTAFIDDEAPNLTYATAPFPLPDDQADQYGRGQIGGTIIGIPKGSPHPAEAWLLVSVHGDRHRRRSSTWRTTSATCRRPSTSLQSPDLDVTPQFQTFLDIFANPNSHYKEPSAIGAADQNIAGGVRRSNGRRARRRIWTPGSRTRPSRSTTSSRRRRSRGGAWRQHRRPSERVGTVRRGRRRSAAASATAALKRGLTVLLFMSPWIVGFLVLDPVPDALEPVLLVHEVQPARSPQWVGSQNYSFMFTKDPLFWLAFRNTVWIILVGVPLRIVFGDLHARGC